MMRTPLELRQSDSDAGWQKGVAPPSAESRPSGLPPSPALRRYGRHDSTCAIFLNGFTENYTLTCSCGFAAVLDSAIDVNTAYDAGYSAGWADCASEPRE